jgi:hypothetical protein
VVHAVARVTDDDSPEMHSRAAAVAADISARTAGSRSSAEFQARAREAPHDGIEVVVEQLPPFDLGGKILEGGSSLDPHFVDAASRLTTRDQQSPPSTSAFGVHIIHLLERSAAHHASDSEIAEVARAELAANRARDALTRLLADARTKQPVTIERDATELLHALDAVRQ